VSIDVGDGSRFGRVKVGVEVVEAVMNILLTGGHTAIWLSCARNVVFVDASVYQMSDEGGWELTSSVRGNAP
jgi:hypothetical protein